MSYMSISQYMAKFVSAFIFCFFLYVLDHQSAMCINLAAFFFFTDISSFELCYSIENSEMKIEQSWKHRLYIKDCGIYNKSI